MAWDRRRTPLARRAGSSPEGRLGTALIPRCAGAVTAGTGHSDWDRPIVLDVAGVSGRMRHSSPHRPLRLIGTLSKGYDVAGSAYAADSPSPTAVIGNRAKWPLLGDIAQHSSAALASDTPVFFYAVVRGKTPADRVGSISTWTTYGRAGRLQPPVWPIGPPVADAECKRSDSRNVALP